MNILARMEMRVASHLRASHLRDGANMPAFFAKSL
jgi:hypothetical protein